MNIDEIRRVFNRRGKVTFKLYGMEYTIIKNSNSASIYPNVYAERIVHFNNLDSLLAKYTVFNENIIDCQKDIKNIKWGLYSFLIIKIFNIIFFEIILFNYFLHVFLIYGYGILF